MEQRAESEATIARHESIIGENGPEPCIVLAEQQFNRDSMLCEFVKWFIYVQNN